MKTKAFAVPLHKPTLQWLLLRTRYRSLDKGQRVECNELVRKGNFGHDYYEQAMLIVETLYSYGDWDNAIRYASKSMTPNSRAIMSLNEKLGRKYKQFKSPAPPICFGKNLARSGFVYLLSAIHDPALFKIGRTNDPDNRLKTFNVKLPFPVEYDCLISTDDMYALESELHAQFADKRLDGEWFRLSADDVDYIRQLARKDE